MGWIFSKMEYPALFYITFHLIVQCKNESYLVFLALWGAAIQKLIQAMV